MALVFVIIPAAHPEVCLAEGMPIFVQRKVLWKAVHFSRFVKRKIKKYQFFGYYSQSI
ncbi:MAG: hypothetical protein HFH10_12515 [Dorea sp.]|nr:hypothetical protein [Dorea sp.]